METEPRESPTPFAKSERFMFATQCEQHLRISKLNSVSFRVNHLQNCLDVAASSVWSGGRGNLSKINHFDESPARANIS